jgi:hypothetical protein
MASFSVSRARLLSTDASLPRRNPPWTACPRPSPPAGADGSITSLKTTGAGRWEARFVFANHQSRVDSGIPYFREKAAREIPLRRNCSTICSRSAALA